MFKNLFKKSKKKWNIVFIDGKGHFKTATLVATDRKDVKVQANRIFKYALVLEMVVV